MKMKNVLAALCLSACLTLGLSTVSSAAGPPGSPGVNVQEMHGAAASKTEPDTESSVREDPGSTAKRQELGTKLRTNITGAKNGPVSKLTGSTDAATDELTMKPAAEPVNENATEPASRSAAESRNEPAVEPTTDSTTEPPAGSVNEPSTEPPAGSVNEPATEPVTEPVTELNTATGTELQNQPPISNGAAEPVEKDGWHTDPVSKKIYYILNHSRVKGLQKIDSDTYYFDTEGFRVSGETQINGKQYYFDGSGIMKFGLQKPNGILKFYNADGSLFIGKNSPQKLGSSLYFIANTGEIKVNSWNTGGGKKYYSSANGALYKGLHTIGSKKYYFDNNGVLTIGKNTAMKIGNYYYFVTTSGEIKTNGWNTDLGKKKYYSNSNGTLVTKRVKKIGAKYYAFHISMYKDCIKTFNGRRYLISSSGVIWTNSIHTYKGKRYCSDKYGRIRTGLFKFSGKKYYANKYGQIKTGRFKANGNFYYANKKGQLYTGWTKYKGRYYFYDTKTAVMKRGWLKRGKATYYLNSSGIRQTGWEKIKNKWYYFGPKGGLVKGLRNIDGKTYYLDSKSGVMRTGWRNVGGGYRYFDKSGGAMRTGWINLGSKTYYLNPDTGIRRTGWFTYNAKKYYFNSKGVMLKGVQSVDGQVYDFGAGGGLDLLKYGALTIKVNRAANCITVYADNEPVKAMLCSTGREVGWTPLGTFTLLDKMRWFELDGPSWGQYCSHITSEILFHSAPVTRHNDPNSLPPATYNQLGMPASHGCIRLTVADAKWLYDHCPVGTRVVVYDDAGNPGPLGKPALQYMGENDTHDPTDPLFH